MDIYLAVIPAEMIRGHPTSHFEGQMHGGVPDDNNHFHIMVSVFNKTTKKPVADASIMAKVIGQKHTGSLQKLERMIIEGKSSFGNYFIVPKDETFNITVKIQMKNSDDAIDTVFVWGRS